MMTISNFVALTIFYGMGWVGAFILLVTCSYIFSTIYHELKLEDLANVNTPWRSLVVDIYEWLDINFYTESVFDSYLKFDVIILMALIASLGPLLFIFAFAIMCIAWIVITSWTNLR